MIGIITQARMTSTRLPAKVAKKVLGKTLLQYHIERLRMSGFPVYVATTTNQTDDILIELCEEWDVPYFRGSEADVLSRFAGLAKTFKLEKVVRVTSDCPLIDGNLIRESYLQYKENFGPQTYVTNCQRRTYPRGFDFEIFSAETLLEIDRVATQPYEREHVTPYIWKTAPEKFEIKHITRADDASEFRMTVDEPDDFKLIEKLIVDHRADLKNAEEIIALFRKYPELKTINAHVEQKKV
ncbi:MAG: acylneuraminate cytidylyltransferase [Pseudobdellovibrio sp.]|jgi:spore coat polysaccharide biosynthesis protein SpsF|nr:acylneuraminate cytidylyltransferase [Pseudobdellovibrio sp.]